MKSYKNWKLVNESFIPGMTLGLSHPQALGLQSNLPGVSLSEKKKMSGDVFTDDGDDDCSCKGKGKDKKKGKKKHDDEKMKFSKKKMKKHMEDDVDDVDGSDHDDDDVNNVDVPDDHGDDDHGDDDHDDDHDDHDDHDDDGDGEDHGEDDGDEEGDDHGDDDHDDDEGDEAPKFGFMKDKKNSKKKRKDEAAFWEDIDASYRVPKEDQGTDKEFFDSLARQYGNPMVRFNGGVDRVDEDLLLSDEQQALIDAMPQPGEVGYAPSQRLGGSFAQSEQPSLGYLPYGESYEESVEDSEDFEVLCKYFSESVARDLIEKKRQSN